jgi:hypothetical protein
VALSRCENLCESLRDKNADRTTKASMVPSAVRTAVYVKKYVTHTATWVFVSATLIFRVLLGYLEVGRPGFCVAINQLFFSFCIS